MTDKELLEMAAKAAGYEVIGMASKFICQDVTDHALLIRNSRGGDSAFDPLTDDGDAFRLAVKLGLTITPNYHVEGPTGSGVIAFTRLADTKDYCAPTKRAIVEAAAEIGKAMP